MAISTSRTQLRGWKPSIDEDDVSGAPFADGYGNQKNGKKVDRDQFSQSGRSQLSRAFTRPEHSADRSDFMELICKMRYGAGSRMFRFGEPISIFAPLRLSEKPGCERRVSR